MRAIPPGFQVSNSAGESVAITPPDARNRYDIGTDNSIGVLP